MIDEEGLQRKAEELIGRRLSDAEMDRACHLLLSVLANHLQEILHEATETGECWECGQVLPAEQLLRNEFLERLCPDCHRTEIERK